jgi:hypothetical protein
MSQSRVGTIRSNFDGNPHAAWVSRGGRPRDIGANDNAVGANWTSVRCQTPSVGTRVSNAGVA